MNVLNEAKQMKQFLKYHYSMPIISLDNFSLQY